jgi:hypothetical protein
MSNIPTTLTPRSCRDLGTALIARACAEEQVNRQGNLELLEDGVERLADLLARGERPSVGFWVRYGRRISDATA